MTQTVILPYPPDCELCIRDDEALSIGEATVQIRYEKEDIDVCPTHLQTIMYPAASPPILLRYETV